MEQIDWSKAPEGATHWDAGMNGRVAGWMKLEDGVWHWWPAKDAHCDRKWYSSLNQYSIEREEFIARPSSWTGEGLPPVGTVCEFIELSNSSRTWEKVRVCYLSQFTFVGENPDAVGYKCEVIVHPHNLKFRPCRTPEQIAAEERESEIIKLSALLKHFETVHQQAERVYNAGYRLQTISK